MRKEDACMEGRYAGTVQHSLPASGLCALVTVTACSLRAAVLRWAAMPQVPRWCSCAMACSPAACRLLWMTTRHLDLCVLRCGWEVLQQTSQHGHGHC